MMKEEEGEGSGGRRKCVCGVNNLRRKALDPCYKADRFADPIFRVP